MRTAGTLHGDIGLERRRVIRRYGTVGTQAAGQVPPAREWLASIGCAGTGTVYRFAQIVAAAALCLEISASAAMATAGSENFFQAHHERGGLR